MLMSSENMPKNWLKEWFYKLLPFYSNDLEREIIY